MKEESRKIIDELITEHSKRMAKPQDLSDEEYESIDKYNHHEDKICEFLESIPQIESHLCVGGYIRDKNGTPCCHGDKVNFQYDEGFYNGTLTFNFTFKCFTIVSKNGVFFWTNGAIKWFEKR